VAKLNIPERYQAGVALIRQLDDLGVQEIRNALDRILDTKTQNQDITTGKKLNELAATAITSTSSKGDIDLKQIAEALVVLYGAKSFKDISVEEFSDNVCDAMEELNSDKLKLPHAEREHFKKKLLTLMSANVFGIASKIVDLRTDDERVFCHARILTDLRPVFGPRIDEGPQGMIVVHLLKLGFHSGSEKHQEFYVSLDSDDLQTLRALLDRAEAKARTLKASLGGIRLFGIAKE